MKYVLTILMVVSVCFHSLAEEPVSENTLWLYNIDAAKKIAQEENKLILISFSGSDWCAPCIRLEQTLFSTEQFKEYAKENLILLKLDFPAQKKNKLADEQLKHNEALAEIYNQQGAFPKVILIDANGIVKGQMEHPKASADNYLESIKKIVN